MTPKRRRIIRLRLLEAQRNLCWICGEVMDLVADEHQPMAVTFDHVVPIHNGGRPSAIGNIKLAHRMCKLKDIHADSARHRVLAICKEVLNEQDA